MAFLNLIKPHRTLQGFIYRSSFTLVLISLKSRKKSGIEVHQDNDQFFRFEKGEGKVIIDDNEYQVKDGDVIIVPSGAN